MPNDPIIEKYKNGNLLSISYRDDDGLYHRLGGPAHQTWYTDGNPEQEIWSRHGDRHRDDGPASIGWHMSGRLRWEMWYINGACHRWDGPAKQEWDASGKILLSSLWYINGVILPFQIIIDISHAYKLPHWSKWTDEQKFLVKLSLNQ